MSAERTKLLRMVLILCAVLILGAAVLSACADGPQLSGPGGGEFIPPTHPLPRTPLMLITPTPERVQPTPQPALSCLDSLSFVDDLTLPDGEQVQPGSPLDKRWQIANSGTCNWDARYSVRLIAGPDMGADPVQALYPARGGTELVIRIQFQAPEEPGAYRSAWQAHDAQGLPFGDPFYVEIVVAGE